LSLNRSQADGLIISLAFRKENHVCVAIKVFKKNKKQSVFFSWNTRQEEINQISPSNASKLNIFA
jgi:hypothetical protein